jgi:lysozyme family protein
MPPNEGQDDLYKGESPLTTFLKGLTDTTGSTTTSEAPKSPLLYPHGVNPDALKPQDMVTPKYAKDFFDSIADQTIKLEGGYANKPNDSGGATMYGISWNNNKDLLKGLGYTPETLKLMPESTAKAIYKRKYYDDPGISSLPQDLQPLVFDFGVHSGTGTAIRQLQSIVGAKPDGSLGPDTLSRINGFLKSQGSGILKDKYLKAREDYLRGLATENPANKAFLNGWLKRIDYLKQTNGLPEVKNT